MAYTYKTLIQAVSDLAERLSGTEMTFWTDPELVRYIGEAIRTFNALASYWRGEFPVNTVANQTWYDFTDIAYPSTLRRRQFYQYDFFNYIGPLMQYHFLEPETISSSSVWSGGSTQFDNTTVVKAVQRASDKILLNTGCYCVRTTVNAAHGRTMLDDLTLEIRRIAWLPTAGYGYENTPLVQDDQMALDTFYPGYAQADQGSPQAYRQSTSPQLSFDVDTQPAVVGDYEILFSPSIQLAVNNWSPVTQDWHWVIKWGAMADLLAREGNQKDSLRAQYCEVRFRQGMAALTASPGLLAAKLNGEPLPVESVSSMDSFNPGWQASTDRPDVAVIAGQNLLGLSPVPDGVYGLMLTVVKDAEIPDSGGDFIQVGRGDYEAIINYAHHLASFKMGGSEFMATIPQYVSFIRQISLYNSKLTQMGEFAKTMLELSQLHSQMEPRFNVTDDPIKQAEQSESGV